MAKAKKVFKKDEVMVIMAHKIVIQQEVGILGQDEIIDSLKMALANFVIAAAIDDSIGMEGALSDFREALSIAPHPYTKFLNGCTIV